MNSRRNCGWRWFYIVRTAEDMGLLDDGDVDAIDGSGLLQTGRRSGAKGSGDGINGCAARRQGVSDAH